ncbi:MAG: hypothetical protein Ct9H300mP19_20110 [Dehalococcoidia bacterium]|nr:MAG: hypothetical protein Ct9H300mP19_20110 [Dehalococcoidia bacterium]
MIILEGTFWRKTHSHPPKGSCYKAKKNSSLATSPLYGSTGGEAYINGMAGERFAVEIQQRQRC